MSKEIRVISALLLCVPFLGHETLYAKPGIRDIWNYKASQWHNFVGKGGEKDLNRKFQVDPALLKAAGNLSGKTVLDAGSGTGYLSAKMAETAKKVIGIDISDRMIEIAKAQYSDDKIEFSVGNLSNMRDLIPNQSIDVIVSNHVLMDLPDLGSTVEEFKRVLRPGGTLVFAILHPCFPMNDASYDGKKAIYAWKSSYFNNYDVRIPPFSKEFDTDFVVFHRPLSAYISAMITNGFHLTELTEPVVAEEHKGKMAPTVFQRFRHAPISIIMAFKKGPSD